MRKPVTVINGDQLYKILLDSLYTQRDSLEMWGGQGTVFFRMQLNKTHFENVQSSEKVPPVLVRIVSNVLRSQEVQVNTKHTGRYYYVLPVRYYFGGGKPGNAGTLISTIPKVDISNLTDKPVNWFNQFFGLEAAEGELKGVPCIFLPWLTVTGKVP